MTDERLIEVAFPLKQASLDSVHEKNVRHGHISTLHIWPARRPLAASRAALIATLLDDPGNAEERKVMLEKLGGHVVDRVKSKKLPGGRVEEQSYEETEGGILHWGRESNADLQWFRDKIRAQYGRAPRVLDPFSGGGAIPLEAMRLGCEVTAVDINPVAWFILKCTLEYPQRLAGKTLPLPEFVLHSREFMESYFKAKGLKGAALNVQLRSLGLLDNEAATQPQLVGVQTHVVSVETDLAWHVRAWGWWVLQQAKADLARFYPVVDGKPTVAYLWARTITCKNCRATIPLLKTRWLCKKEKKRVVLTMEPNADRTGVVFGIQTDAPPLAKGKASEKREYDKQLAGGTMSGSGVTCPCCGTVTKMEDIRREAKSGRLSSIMTAVVVDGTHDKEYRLPTQEEITMAVEAEQEVARVFADIPFGIPEEPLPAKEALGFRVPQYGFDQWYKLFTPRQLAAHGTFVKYTRLVRDVMQNCGYSVEWIEIVVGYLAVGIDKLADYISSLCIWNIAETINHVLTRFALPMNWDFAELNPLSNSTGNYFACLDWVAQSLEHITHAVGGCVEPHVFQQSAIDENRQGEVDIIVTDPPYYDAIPYSDLMDFFYVWLRRTLFGLSQDMEAAFQKPLSPKWDHDHNNGELIDDSSRFGGDKHKSKANYEAGMYRAFQACYQTLSLDGRLVIVFAHKQPDAWETLVSALIKAGFVVDSSWPIMTERSGGVRNHNRASLASSIWLVCKKRPENAKPGWDNRVLLEMEAKVTQKLRDFWDAGIRGPDFVWSATGPALEAYSKHPVVRMANEDGQTLSVSDFLRHVRRMVADFVVGRVLSRGSAGTEAVTGLDDVTTYYLLHRNDFGMESAPIGPCILYAVSCGLSDSQLINKYDLLTRTGGQTSDDDEGDEEEGAGSGEETSEVAKPEGTTSTVKLKTWQQRKYAGMEEQGLFGGAPAPLIDQVHRLMHLWRAGDVIKVDEYLDIRGLGHNRLFHQLLQALIELAPEKSDERALLENISNHVNERGLLPTYSMGILE